MQRWTARPCYIPTAVGPCLHWCLGNVPMKTLSDIKEGFKKKKFFISLSIHFRDPAPRISMSLLNWPKTEQWGKWTMPSCNECINSLCRWCVWAWTLALVSPFPHLRLIPVTPSDKLESGEQTKIFIWGTRCMRRVITLCGTGGAQIAITDDKQPRQERRASWDRRGRRACAFMPRTGDSPTPESDSGGEEQARNPMQLSRWRHEGRQHSFWLRHVRKHSFCLFHPSGEINLLSGKCARGVLTGG